MALANDGVELPITQAGAVLHDGRTCLNGNPVAQLATAVIGPAAFLARLLATQMAVKVTAPGLVLKDGLIDPLVADGQTPFRGQLQAGLLGTPVLAQQAFDHAPVLGVIRSKTLAWRRCRASQWACCGR